jgi:twinkle protein
MKTFQEYGIFVPSTASGEIRVKCPRCTPGRKHKNEKDLCVNIEKGTGFCQHCGWSFTLQEKEQASKSYAKPAFIYIDLPEKILTYLQGRGLTQNTLSENKVTAGKVGNADAVKFPYFKYGECVNVKYRTLDKRFCQEKNAEPCLYRFDAIEQCEELIITEGEFDALSFCEAGQCNATSVPNGAPAPNAKNYTKEFAYLESAQHIFENCRKVFLAVDNDAAGKLLEQELARRIGVEKCYRVQFPAGCKDANDVLVKFGREILKDCIAKAEPYPVDGIFMPSQIEDLILHLYDCGQQSGVSTGWPNLDPFYTVKTGQMSIVTGIPGSGKTEWLDALLVNLAVTHGWSFALFSPENWPIERHAQSLIEKLYKMPFHATRGAKAINREGIEEAIGEINGRFFFIMPPEDEMTIDAILDKARVTIFRYGIKGLVIDPWNEIDHRYGNLSETQYISEALGKIRRFARRNDIHIWIVAHPQKLLKDKDSGKYKPPTMYEISGGAHWRNKADIGLCVHRPDMNSDITELYVQKIRFREVGKLGAVKFKYARATGNYIDNGELGGKAAKGDSVAEGYKRLPYKDEEEELVF